MFLHLKRTSCHATVIGDLQSTCLTPFFYSVFFYPFRLGSGRKDASKSSGFRLAHKILRVASHRQLLELLNYLLRLLPSLASGDVLKYLTDAGINVSEALRQQTGQKQRMGINK